MRQEASAAQPLGWQSLTGRPAPGSSGLPPTNRIVQELDLVGVELAAAALVALDVDPHPEGVFTLRTSVRVAGPVVASSLAPSLTACIQRRLQVLVILDVR